jgi:hypothetical protein
LAPPISGCHVTLSADELTFNTIVDLEAEFKVMLPLEINGTVEFAFPGFKADFENKSDIHVETEVTFPEDPDYADNIFAFPPYEPFIVEGKGVDGCFKYYIETDGKYVPLRAMCLCSYICIYKFYIEKDDT